MSNVIEVDDFSFEKEVLQSNDPVLVEFGATWCGPCKRQLPILEKLADEHVGKLKVVKVDVDEAPAISSKYGIRSVPTLFVFSNGAKIDSTSGLTSLAELKSKLLSKVGI